ncbi:hypothetical protein NDU88_007188 [Pleurodeles waltl]|uniref:Uncharacterized protein n=1 Tax=Pleurodeles waltl TaxID=8319 RepID=A0AAV7PNK9_PLEWA|nr:hypothetical protein NDU88_007188 [Pleurodeles waltl]
MSGSGAECWTRSCGPPTCERPRLTLKLGVRVSGRCGWAASWTALGPDLLCFREHGQWPRGAGEQGGCSLGGPSRSTLLHEAKRHCALCGRVI